MDKDHLRKLHSKLEQEKDLCSWASIYSTLTWNKIAFIRSLHRGKIYETSLTQDFVYQFYLMAAGRELPIELFEAWDEEANGNDLELFIEKENGYVCIPLQAKLIGADNRYGKINHQVGRRFQIDALLNYGKRMKGLPLYLFYNAAFVPEWEFDLTEDNDQQNNIEEFGCSLITAAYIKKMCYNKRKSRTGGLA